MNVTVIQPAMLVGHYGANWPLRGEVSGQVFVKASPTAPEQPAPHARVVLIRAEDGRRAWAGWADAQGCYRADGLHAGRWYVPVGIDPSGQHQATAAGPVQAVQAQQASGEGA